MQLKTGDADDEVKATVNYLIERPRAQAAALDKPSMASATRLIRAMADVGRAVLRSVSDKAEFKVQVP